MKKFLVALLACTVAVGFVTAGDAPEGKKEEKAGCPCQKNKMAKVAVADIPAAVKAAAEKEVEGIAISEALTQKKDDKVIYKVMGKVGEKEYCVMVDAEGNVLKKMEKGECKKCKGEPGEKKAAE